MGTQEFDSHDLEVQASLFSKYLIGLSPNELSVKLYVKAMPQHSLNLTKSDQKLLDFINHHRWSVGLIDAGLALKGSKSNLRKRMFLMFSILESMPDYHKHFLGEGKKRRHITNVIYTGVMGVIKALIGVMLIQAIS